jgi:hypothetical protein
MKNENQEIKELKKFYKQFQNIMKKDKEIKYILIYKEDTFFKLYVKDEEIKDIWSFPSCEILEDYEYLKENF